MTNAMESHFDSILSAVRECDPANLPILIGALEQAKAEAWGRLSTPVVPLPQETKAQERLLTPEEAASIARSPYAGCTAGRAARAGRVGPRGVVFASAKRPSAAGWR
jgi:hypothetical protein